MARSRKTTTQENEIRMTQDAYDELVKELDYRQNVLRKEIADEIADARELGDLSENHAYTVAMERKDLNENRISEIEDILQKAEIVEENKSDSLVSVGETVEIQNIETKDKKVLTLVGSEETKSANPMDGKISTDSPVGRALYNAQIGDTVDVILPSKVIKYKILKFVRK
jgi:transcription elongation factor GreA